MCEVRKSDIDQFNAAYVRNKRIFARHRDLIKILNWGRERYERVVLHLAESGRVQLEGGSPNHELDDFPVRNGSGSICYSVRRVIVQDQDVLPKTLDWIKSEIDNLRAEARQ